MLLIFFKIKSLQPVVTLRPLFVFGLIPFDLSVAIGEGSALRSGGCALEQQQRIVGHAVKIEIGLSICRLAIDFLPITAVPEGEQVFVSGIEIITVASPEVDDLGDVDRTAEVETCPDVISVACETGPLGLRTSPAAENAILALCLSCFIQRYYDKV